MEDRSSSEPRGSLPAFAVMSLSCVGVGCWMAAAHGVPPGVWLRNLAAWTLGLGIAALLARTAGSARASVGFLLAAPVGLIVTLLSPGLNGVHRWAQLGPTQVNVAEILLPPALVALAVLSPERLWTWFVAAAVAVLLIAQPDASQATAFGGATIASILLSPLGRGLRWGGVAAAVVAIAAAWLRPDPLTPVPEVEGIFRLAWAISPLVVLPAGVALCATAFMPMLAACSGGAISRSAAKVLVVYFVTAAVMPFAGAFPVPLVGMGMSPILGWWLGAGLLVALAGPRPTSSPPP